MTDVIWLILDSLSFSVTPFAVDGPDSMPNLERIAKKEAVIYSDAYAPGLFSAPSHASFFTGYLPSETGMHHANPHFPGNHETIAEMLSDTHESYIITDNPFVHNGLSDTFDNNHRIPVSNWEIFDDDAASIDGFLRETGSNGATKYAEFVFKGGKPLRSMANGISYKVQQKLSNVGRGPSRASLGSWGPYICDKIESYVSGTSHDVLVVANFMDPHPPFDPSGGALERFLPDVHRTELPLGVSGAELQEYDLDTRMGLLKAAAWDLDSHIGPLLEKLVDEEAFVIVTADHGHGFHRSKRFERERIHVPLLIFSPEDSQREIDHTVNIRELPVTTMQSVQGASDQFPGTSLLDVDEDRVSITESIRTASEETNQIDVRGARSDDLVYELVGVSGEGWVEYVGGELSVRSGDDEQTHVIIERIRELLDRDQVALGSERPEYDAETIQRLKDFGYL